ncbi:MAG: hypothetical protein COT73_05280 [Bdellovibrio sp. CG10_big_fil_rev_8_21_14_0_10_47_8]|nr:MAG: hypothetical protein COT73_05280 [Bdellovibrio sp. CG10_big_fil_rev_8_21_14_0_10_47_8]
MGLLARAGEMINLRIWDKKWPSVITEWIVTAKIHVVSRYYGETQAEPQLAIPSRIASTINLQVTTGLA